MLVDEFQDANIAQIALLELVGRGPDKPDNVVVVGDDDQSIYRFRGASGAQVGGRLRRCSNSRNAVYDELSPKISVQLTATDSSLSYKS